jgi:hypothetical protein
MRLRRMREEFASYVEQIRRELFVEGDDGEDLAAYAKRL